MASKKTSYVPAGVVPEASSLTVRPSTSTTVSLTSAASASDMKTSHCERVSLALEFRTWSRDRMTASCHTFYGATLSRLFRGLKPKEDTHVDRRGSGTGRLVEPIKPEN